MDPWSAVDLRRTLQSGQVVEIASDSDWWVYNEVFVDRVYDDAIERALGRAVPGSPLVCVDLGANVGFFSARVVELAHMRGVEALRLYLVEGSPTLAGALPRRLRSTPPAVVVEVIHGLVGQRRGRGALGEVAFSARNSLSLAHNAGITPPGEIPVRPVDYVDLAEVVPEQRIDLLKCDVEGAEQTVLETYADDVLPRVGVAVVELHRRLVDVDACRAALHAGGLTEIAVLEETAETLLVLAERGSSHDEEPEPVAGADVEEAS